MFRFANPWIFALLPAVLAAAWALARRRSRADARLYLPGSAAKGRAARTGWIGLDALLPVLRATALVLLVAALARPQSGAREETMSTQGVDIVVALDTSGSMRAEDFGRSNRLDVAKRTVAEFVSGRPSDRIGLVIFAALATTRCPLTLDHDMLGRFLEEVDFAPQEEDGTALGMGLATAVSRLRSSPAKSKLVVLVTDGRNNRGQIGPDTAARMAQTLGIRVYTVGVGAEGESRVPVETPFGRRYVLQRLDLDEALLESIARGTSGRYFRATDAEGLRQVFATIDSLEKTEIESRVRVLYTERFSLALAPAGLLLLLERFLAATRLRRIP